MLKTFFFYRVLLRELQAIPTHAKLENNLALGIAAERDKGCYVSFHFFPIRFYAHNCFGENWQREGFTKAYRQNPGDRQATECTQQVLTSQTEKANL